MKCAILKRMGFDYDKLYANTPNALGDPTQVFVDFFDCLDRTVHVLDVGCGQGRDAIFIARKGHSVVGVDMSPNGIRDLEQQAVRENLHIRGIVADLSHFTPHEDYDVVLIDRTLHMLDRSERLAALCALLKHVKANGWLLIADERTNIPDFKEAIAADNNKWRIILEKRGTLFAQRI